METRVKNLEQELSSTRKQYEEAKANAFTIGAKLSQAEKEIQVLRNQLADAVAQINRYKKEIVRKISSL
ncbi:hypothetical protein ACJMK2_002416 [Sinanodonta woodiana]|uniref:Uncharacterized protein n=1 Tax=Sinanodonta woodiana TaxID=1069815 RepID=A0ABD3XYQ4_SINWO